MKINEIPKKIYELEVKTIKLVEELIKTKIKMKNFSNEIMIGINCEVKDNKKVFKNAIEREKEFITRSLASKEYREIENDVRFKEISLKKCKYYVDYYNNVLKTLPYRDQSFEEMSDEEN